MSASPPPIEECQGQEPLQVEIQGSLDGGSTWELDGVAIFAYPGQEVELLVRTRMTNLSGQTEGWSFSVEHDASELQYQYGDMILQAVTIEGTDTATVKNGSPPDFNDTTIQTEFSRYMQGIIIDTANEITLPPTRDFVTSLACYHITIPWWGSYYEATIRFNHDLGDPPIHTVIVQQGEGYVPCTRDYQTTFTIWI